MTYQSGMKDLRALREAQGLTQGKLAALTNTSQPQLARLESGKRKLSKEWAEKLAPHLKVSAMDLLFEFGSEPMVRFEEVPEPSEEQRRSTLAGGFRPEPLFMNYVDTMPVYASAEGGNGHVIITTDEIDRVPRPYTLGGIPDAYAILITGESMVPAYEPGDYAWVNPRLPPQRDTDCILYSIDDESGEGTATIKRLLSWDAKAWNLRQYTPGKDFPLERKIWARHHRVVGNFRRR